MFYRQTKSPLSRTPEGTHVDAGSGDVGDVMIRDGGGQTGSLGLDVYMHKEIYLNL